MTEHREDKAFKDYLGGRSRLSDSYARLKDVGPPEDLDRRILAEARREVERRSRKTMRWWRPWPALATLAVACIAVIVSLDLLRTQSIELSHAPRDSIGQLEMPVDDADAGRAADFAAAEKDEGVASLQDVAREEFAELAAGPGATQAETRRQDPVSGRLVESSGQETQKVKFAARAVAPAAVAKATDLQEAEVPADQAVAIGDALAIARERVYKRRREASEHPVEPTPEADRNTRTLSQPVASAPGTRPATSILSDDPELWLEFIDVLMEQGAEDLAAEQARLFSDTFPERTLDARHEALLAD